MKRNMIYNTDCIAGMSMLPDQSVDMILSDLPYAVTNCHWDSLIPFDKLWEQYKRIIKPNGAIVLTCCQPFTTDLISSNRPWFRYCWYWHKNCATGFTFAKKQPMRCIEDIAVFYSKPPVYNPQGLIKLERPRLEQSGHKGGGVYKSGLDKPHVVEYVHYPRNLLEVPCERGLPKAARGYWSPAEVIRWKEAAGAQADEPDGMTAVQRKIHWEAECKKAQTEAQQFKNAVTRGEYLEREQMQQELYTFFTVFKQMALALPRHIAVACAQYAGAEAARKIEGEATEEVQNVLEQWSRGNFAAGLDWSGTEGVKAPGKAYSKRVGRQESGTGRKKQQ